MATNSNNTPAARCGINFKFTNPTQEKQNLLQSQQAYTERWVANFLSPAERKAGLGRFSQEPELLLIDFGANPKAATGDHCQEYFENRIPSSNATMPLRIPDPIDFKFTYAGGDPCCDMHPNYKFSIYWLSFPFGQHEPPHTKHLATIFSSPSSFSGKAVTHAPTPSSFLEFDRSFGCHTFKDHKFVVRIFIRVVSKIHNTSAWQHIGNRIHTAEHKSQTFDCMTGELLSFTRFPPTVEPIPDSCEDIHVEVVSYNGEDYYVEDVDAPRSNIFNETGDVIGKWVNGKPQLHRYNFRPRCRKCGRVEKHN